MLPKSCQARSGQPWHNGGDSGIPQNRTGVIGIIARARGIIALVLHRYVGCDAIEVLDAGSSAEC